MRSQVALAPAVVGLLGKAPCHGDFLRLNAADALGQAFHRWLEDGMTHVRQGGGSLPAPVYFHFAPRGAGRALWGALAPSTDAVGRAFPLAVFAHAPASEAAAWPGLPLVARPFLEAAAAVLREAGGLRTDALGARVQALQLPAAAELAQAGAAVQRLLAGAAPEALLGAVADPQSGEGPFYAVRTALAAVEAARAQPGQAPVLDCPVPLELGPTAWLELLRRRGVGRDGAPSFFWCEQPAPRLLVALGEPPPSVLGFLTRPEHASPRLWPLRTRQAAALAASRAALAPAHRTALERPPATLAALLDTLAT